MIIYGTRGKLIGIKKASTSCFSCGAKGYMSYMILGKYAHIMFIPLFPLGKKVHSYCEYCEYHCEYGSSSGYMCPNEATILLKQTPYPKWFFIGPALYALLCALHLFGTMVRTF